MPFLVPTVGPAILLFGRLHGQKTRTYTFFSAQKFTKDCFVLVLWGYSSNKTSRKIAARRPPVCNSLFSTRTPLRPASAPLAPRETPSIVSWLVSWRRAARRPTGLDSGPRSRLGLEATANNRGRRRRPASGRRRALAHTRFRFFRLRSAGFSFVFGFRFSLTEVGRRTDRVSLCVPENWPVAVTDFVADGTSRRGRENVGC